MASEEPGRVQVQLDDLIASHLTRVGHQKQVLPILTPVPAQQHITNSIMYTLLVVQAINRALQMRILFLDAFVGMKNIQRNPVRIHKL